jgi:hypothetical protein
VILNRPAPLGSKRQPLEAGDLERALEPGGVIVREVADQVADPVAKLQGEVRRGGTAQLADVLDGRLAPIALGQLELAHAVSLSGPHYGAFACTGISSVIWSMRACWRTEIVLSSPRIQTRLYTAWPGSSS